MKNNNTFRKTEQLLYNYTGFKNSIKLKKDYIDFLTKYGIQEHSKNFVGCLIEVGDKDKEDVLQNKIEELQQDILFLQKCIEYIDLSLERVKDDSYYELIELKYFNKKSMEYIAEYFDTATMTIYRNRKRLINKIRNYIFSSEVLEVIFDVKEGK